MAPTGRRSSHRVRGAARSSSPPPSHRPSLRGPRPFVAPTGRRSHRPPLPPGALLRQVPREPMPRSHLPAVWGHLHEESVLHSLPGGADPGVARGGARRGQRATEAGTCVEVARRGRKRVAGAKGRPGSGLGDRLGQGRRCPDRREALADLLGQSWHIEPEKPTEIGDGSVVDEAVPGDSDDPH